MMLKPDDEFMAAYERAEENELRHASSDDDETDRKRRRRTALAVGGAAAAGAAITAAVMNRRSGGTTPAAAPAAAKTPLDTAFEESRADKVGVKGRTIKRGGRPGVTYRNARAYYAPEANGRIHAKNIAAYNASVGGLKPGTRYKIKSPAPRPEPAEPSAAVSKEFEKSASTRRLRAKKL